MLENQLNQCFMVIFSFFIVRRSGNPGYNLHSRVNYNVERCDLMSLVYVTNKNNGTTYGYESTNYWDKEKK